MMKTYGKLFDEVCEEKKDCLSKSQLGTIQRFFRGTYRWLLEIPYDMVSKEMFDFCVLDTLPALRSAPDVLCSYMPDGLKT